MLLGNSALLTAVHAQKIHPHYFQAPDQIPASVYLTRKQQLFRMLQVGILFLLVLIIATFNSMKGNPWIRSPVATLWLYSPVIPNCVPAKARKCEIGRAHV